MRNFIFAVLIFLMPMIVVGQTSAPATTPVTSTPPTVPTDPKELLLQASTLNGLSGDAIKPWHLKASIQILDENGGIVNSGIYESFWVSEKKYKRTFTTSSSTLTDYGTDKGIVYIQTGNAPVSMALALDHAWMKPIPTAEAIGRYSFTQTQTTMGPVTLNCISAQNLTDDKPLTMMMGMYFCFQPGQSILRLSYTGTGYDQMVHNRILTFQGKQIAGDLMFARMHKPSLKAHVDLLESLAQINDADFVPPADAKTGPRRVSISGGVMAGMILKKANPRYPEKAKIDHVQGTVVLKAEIDMSGKISNVEVVSGPLELQQEAVDTVKQWVYKTYYLNGEPVMVDTQINVVFLLGG